MVRSVRLLVLLAIAPAIASADDSSFYGAGSSVTSLPEPRVRMVSEDISIRENPLPPTHPLFELAPPSWNRDGLPHVVRFEARCEFVFENLTDEPVDVLMGFPDTFEGNDEGMWPEMWMLQDFRARIEGREVETKHVSVEWARPAPEQDMAEFWHAWTWPVRFKPRERLRVTNAYRFGGRNGFAYLWGLQRGPEPPLATACWSVAPKPACGDDIGQWGESVAYIVTTRNVWGGSIGRADIRIELPTGSLPSQILAIPRATSISPTEVRWHFENWEPTGDVGVAFVDSWCCHESTEATPCPLCRDPEGPAFHSSDQAQAWVDWARRNGVDRAAARIQRNAIHAEHGRSFSDPRLQRAFLATTWYRPRPLDQQEPLTAEEWRIIDILQRFERSLP